MTPRGDVPYGSARQSLILKRPNFGPRVGQDENAREGCAATPRHAPKGIAAGVADSGPSSPIAMMIHNKVVPTRPRIKRGVLAGGRCGGGQGPGRAPVGRWRSFNLLFHDRPLRCSVCQASCSRHVRVRNKVYWGRAAAAAGPCARPRACVGQDLRLRYANPFRPAVSGRPALPQPRTGQEVLHRQGPNFPFQQCRVANGPRGTPRVLCPRSG